MATIERRETKGGSIRYRVLIRLKGVPSQSATFARKTDAKKWAQDTEAAIRDGRYFKTAEARKHTLAEAVDRYSSTELARRSEARREDPARHLCWWTDRLGPKTLADVTHAVISEQRDLLAQEPVPGGKTRSPATVNRYLGSLSHLFSTALEWGWVEENPLSRVKRLSEPRGRVRFLDKEEKARLLAACQESQEPRLYPLVLLSISIGARQGELLSLRWPDVDLEKGKAILHETKNRERRALPLAGEALDLLRKMARVRRIDTDLVFASGSGEATFPRWAWEKALKQAGVENFRWHDLRHTCASYLAMSGATLAEIAEVLGHKTLAMVKRYAHLSEQHTSRVVERMNAKFLN